MYEIGLIAVGAVFGGFTAFVLVSAAMVANRGKAADAALDAALSELAQYCIGYMDAAQEERDPTVARGDT